MKKIFNLLFAVAFVFAFTNVLLAEEKSYEFFDFRVEMKPGELIKSSELKIFASIEGEEDNLVDRTNEFNIVNNFWSFCETEDCTSTREVEDDSVFEENHKYLLTIYINAKNGADINAWSADRAKLNGTSIEDLGGEYGNTGKELMLKPRINATPVTVTPNDITEETPEVISPNTETKSCMFNLPICCNMFLGLSICIWILIIIIVLLIIIIACFLKSKNKKQE